MNPTSISSDESIAVDVIADEIALLERRVEAGQTVDSDNLELLMQLNVRLARLVSVLNQSVTAAPRRCEKSKSASARKDLPVLSRTI